MTETQNPSPELVMRGALEPFAKIVPSSLYPADGSEAEEYVVILQTDRKWQSADFTGADLARARQALSASPVMGEWTTIIEALRAPSYQQDSQWHDPKTVVYVTKPKALLEAAADALLSVQRGGGSSSSAESAACIASDGTDPIGGASLDFSACEWPADTDFGFHDDPGEHDPCYVVMPGGAMIAFNHDARPGVDIARARFVQAACNFALTKGGRS